VFSFPPGWTVISDRPGCRVLTRPDASPNGGKIVASGCLYVPSVPVAARVSGASVGDAAGIDSTARRRSLALTLA
jgi:hypothetical protein